MSKFEPPNKLVIDGRISSRPELDRRGSRALHDDAGTDGGSTKLTILHEMERPESKLIEAVSDGWPKILSNLKSLLETGEVALT